MHKRWYDHNPTVSMAVSLLQNAQPSHREEAIEYIHGLLRELYPWVFNRVRQEPNGFFALPVIQKRRSMDQKSWAVVETLRYLPDADKESLAVEMIRYIYCLESEEKPVNFGFGQFGAAAV